MTNSLVEKAHALKKIIVNSSRIRITTHKNPDGDAVGSLVAFSCICSYFGKEYDMVLDDNLPINLLFLPRASEICRHSFGDAQLELSNEQTDTIVFLDCGSLSRAGFVENDIISRQTIVNIDHHHTNPNFGHLNIIEDISSTCELLALLMKILNIPISRDCAEALYTGIVTDTGFFQFEKTSPATHRTAADILDTGLSQTAIHRHLNQSLPIEWLLLVKKMIDHLESYFNGRLVISYISQKDVTEAKGVDLTNFLLPLMASIDSVQVYVLIKEKEDGTISASLRSKNEIDVSQIAAVFGGGGHQQAAACRMSDQTIEDFMVYFPQELLKLLKDKML